MKRKVWTLVVFDSMGEIAFIDVYAKKRDANKAGRKVFERSGRSWGLYRSYIVKAEWE